MPPRPPFPTHSIRAIDPNSTEEIEWVANRMRRTLVEVLGQEKGGSMYTMDWLTERVRFHLDAKRSTAQVFVSVDRSGTLNGHAIVRLERTDGGKQYGLFSTIFVEPASRNRGIGGELLGRVEQWLIAHRTATIRYCTADSNRKLIHLFHKHGYAITDARADQKMIILEKSLPAHDAHHRPSNLIE